MTDRTYTHEEVLNILYEAGVVGDSEKLLARKNQIICQAASTDSLTVQELVFDHFDIRINEGSTISAVTLGREEAEKLRGLLLERIQEIDDEGLRDS